MPGCGHLADRSGLGDEALLSRRVVECRLDMQSEKIKS